MTKYRKIKKVVSAREVARDKGLIVRRPFPGPEIPNIDPFILFDELGPGRLKKGDVPRMEDHPHKGFESVTYLLDGEIDHHDSRGHHGRLQAGDVQWMNAGHGLLHSEVPTRKMIKKGGRMHAFNIWINLNRAGKKNPPEYKPLPSTKIPRLKDAHESVSIDVIAGSLNGTSSGAKTNTPIFCFRISLKAHSSFTLPMQEEFNIFAYLFSGKGSFGNRQVLEKGKLILFEKGTEPLMFRTRNEPMEFLLLGGEPLNEPMVRRGPFVMNSSDEILDAIADYRAGRLGKIS